MSDEGPYENLATVTILAEAIDPIDRKPKRFPVPV
jgi:hypothetical protein